MEQIRLINKFSISDYSLIVCDDGSTDGTIEQLRQNNIPYITGLNRGVAWNKNRGIYYLANYTHADHFILLDDDAYPTTYGWEIEWSKGAQFHGHVTYIQPNWQDLVLFGNYTASNPAISPMIAGSCIAISREAFAVVGYMDNRFGRYGHEHTDYSSRFVKAGFGGIVKHDQTLLYATLQSGINLIPIESTGSAEEIEKNKIILHQLANEPIFRLPWFTEEQKKVFLKELIDKSQTTKIPEWEILKDFDRDFYLQTYSDVRQSGFDPVTHYYLYGQYEERKKKAE